MFWYRRRQLDVKETFEISEIINVKLWFLRKQNHKTRTKIERLTAISSPLSQLIHDRKFHIRYNRIVEKLCVVKSNPKESLPNNSSVSTILCTSPNPQECTFGMLHVYRYYKSSTCTWNGQQTPPDCHLITPRDASPTATFVTLISQITTTRAKDGASFYRRSWQIVPWYSQGTTDVKCYAQSSTWIWYLSSSSVATPRTRKNFKWP